MERLWDAEYRRGHGCFGSRRSRSSAEHRQSFALTSGGCRGACAGRQDVAARIFNHLVTPSGTKIAHGAGDLAEYAG